MRECLCPLSIHSRRLPRLVSIPPSLPRITSFRPTTDPQLFTNTISHPSSSSVVRPIMYSDDSDLSELDHSDHEAAVSPIAGSSSPKTYAGHKRQRISTRRTASQRANYHEPDSDDTDDTASSFPSDHDTSTRPQKTQSRSSKPKLAPALASHRPPPGKRSKRVSSASAPDSRPLTPSQHESEPPSSSQRVQSGRGRASSVSCTKSRAKAIATVSSPRASHVSDSTPKPSSHLQLFSSSSNIGDSIPSSQPSAPEQWSLKSLRKVVWVKLGASGHPVSASDDDHEEDATSFWWPALVCQIIIQAQHYLDEKVLMN